MRILYAVLAVFFLLSAAVQYNDPDPVPWMLLYGAVSVLMALAALERNYHPLYRPAVGICIVAATGWALMLAPDFINWLRMGMPTIVGTMKAETPYVELTREFFGLLLAAGASALLLVRRWN
jgi:hypothetical protein